MIYNARVIRRGDEEDELYITCLNINEDTLAQLEMVYPSPRFIIDAQPIVELEGPEPF